MSDGITMFVMETHNWGKTAKFLQRVGFSLDFETDHNSGQLSNGDGAPVFVVEVPEGQEPRTAVVVAVPDESVDAELDVVTPFEDTHYGTREMTVRDPDGRIWTLRAPK
ncbi:MULTISPECIES: VOC family protein [Amycolatopsis]|uniref:VOC family protein n=1 Tax=Amycolatopsis dendrobii TaxID=2760662 RepID=A0A7W3W4X2_9PSEU|nr:MULTISPECIES: VOC family protein [Amycolatopsis]MBB1158911.1 VOC family protein [Amycolatopsis dendrobii]UKD55072.1 VOC family protein [Amycolatopsis sp. FU40]